MMSLLTVDVKMQYTTFSRVPSERLLWIVRRKGISIRRVWNMKSHASAFSPATLLWALSVCEGDWQRPGRASHHVHCRPWLALVWHCFNTYLGEITNYCRMTSISQWDNVVTWCSLKCLWRFSVPSSSEIICVCCYVVFVLFDDVPGARREVFVAWSSTTVWGWVILQKSDSLSNFSRVLTPPVKMLRGKEGKESKNLHDAHQMFLPASFSYICR